MVHFNEKSFQAALKEDGLLMVDFWAPWCGPCQMLGPVIESLAEQYEGKAVIGKVNTDEEPVLSIGLGVSNIPTVIFFKNGREIHREIGAMPPQVYARVLEENV